MINGQNNMIGMGEKGKTGYNQWRSQKGTRIRAMNSKYAVLRLSFLSLRLHNITPIFDKQIQLGIIYRKYV